MVLVGHVEEQGGRRTGGPDVVVVSEDPEQAHRGHADGLFDGPGAPPALLDLARPALLGDLYDDLFVPGAGTEPAHDPGDGLVRQFLYGRVPVHELGLAYCLFVRELLARQRRVEERAVDGPVRPGEHQHPAGQGERALGDADRLDVVGGGGVVQGARDLHRPIGRLRRAAQCDRADGPLLPQEGATGGTGVPQHDLVDALVARRRLSGQGGTEPHPHQADVVHSALAHEPQSRPHGRHPRFGPARVVIAAGGVTGAVVIEPQGTKTAGGEALRQQPQRVVSMEQVESERRANDGSPNSQTVRRAVEPPEGGAPLVAEPNGTGGDAARTRTNAQRYDCRHARKHPKALTDPKPSSPYTLVGVTMTRPVRPVPPLELQQEAGKAIGREPSTRRSW